MSSFFDPAEKTNARSKEQRLAIAARSEAFLAGGPDCRRPVARRIDNKKAQSD
jgi:hypothetical protein